MWYNIDTKEREEYTMANTVKRTMYYPTFNEKRNEFDYKEVTHERTATEKERNIYFKYYATCWLFVALIAVYAVGLILALAYKIDLWDLLLIPITVAWAWLLKLELDYCFSLEEKINGFNDWGFETEILKWEQQTEEQNEIAKKWRAEHEFAELIRQARLTQSSVDIAKVAVYYADYYIKGE
jgi:hypothetical protein